MSQRILVFRSGRLGDFVVALPAIAKLRQSYPGSRICLLSMMSARADVRALGRRYVGSRRPPWIDAAMPQFLDEAIVAQSVYNWSDLISVREAISQFDPTIAVVLPFTWESYGSYIKKWAYLRIVGVSCHILTGGLNLPRSVVRHQVESALEGVRELVPREASMKAVRLETKPLAREWANAQLGRDSRLVFVAIFPGGTYSHKRWGIEAFQKVCRALVDWRSNIRIVVVGSKADDFDVAALACGDNTRFIDLHGRTSLEQMAAVLERCRLFIGNDSGPGHVAALVGCRTITLMSSVFPKGLWEPRGIERSSTVRYAVPCANCGNDTYCPTGTCACIRQISEADVIQCAKDMLSE